MSINTQAKDMIGFLIYHLEESLFFFFFLSSKFLENFFVEGKRTTDPDVIYQLGNLTLGALSYLHVGFHLGGDLD